MVGAIISHLLFHVGHDMLHEAQSLANNFARGRISCPIPDANCLDAVAQSEVPRLGQERESAAGVRVGQGEDQALVEELMQLGLQSLGPRVDCRRVGVPMVARRDPRIVLSA